jgi:hypothetical protein
MATTIVTKYGGDAPAASDIVRGELAVDTENGRLYTENAAGAVVEIGLNPEGNVDVTGSVTADGLTVDGSYTQSKASGTFFTLTDTTNSKTGFINWESGNWNIFTNGPKKRWTIADNGDISFYEDTGTSQALYWDASAESLGIGTSSPTGGDLHVAGSTDSTVRVEATSGNDASLFLTEAGTGNVGAQLVYDGGDNKLYFKVGNNTDLTRMTIERDTGNVGIGAAPNTRLQVSSATTTKSVVETTGAASDALIEFTKGQGSGNTWSMGLDHSNSSAFSLAYLSNGSPSLTTHGLVTVDTSGNVGIGTSSITSNTILHMKDTDAQIELESTNGSNSAFIDFDGTNLQLSTNRNMIDGAFSNTGKSSAGIFLVGPSGGSLIRFATASADNTTPSTRMTLDSRGVLGINAVPEAWDAAFSSVLQVGPMSVLTSGGDNARIFGNAYYDGGATYKRINTGYAEAYEQTTGEHRWYNAASGAADSTFTWSESMRIGAGGNLVIGKTVTALETAGHTFGNDGYVYHTRNGNIMWLNQLASSGNAITFMQNTATVGSVSVTTTATAYNTSSDQRLKENIVDAPSASDDIDAIQVRSFDWKADGEHQKYGMIAQELLEVAPEAVSAPEDPEEMMGVDYSKLVPMMLKEIQSLRARVAQLES